MLTVKHISDAFGVETIFTAPEVSFIPRRGDGGASVVFEGHENIRCGQVYVMNEHGKTVAKYDLREQEKSAAQCFGTATATSVTTYTTTNL